MPEEITVSTRAKSPSRTEAITKALVNRPIYGNGVLIGLLEKHQQPLNRFGPIVKVHNDECNDVLRGCWCFSNNPVNIANWVEDRIECLKNGTLYFPPKEEIDYKKMTPESRQQDFRQNKLNSTQSNFSSIMRHDSHDACDNYATTNDLVYHHLPKPLCGPNQRYYKRAKHQFYPQPDLMKCFGNVTEWGLRKQLKYEWKCTDVSDYISTLYEDTFVPPQPHQYLQRNERRARNSSFTKSFCFKMTKSKQ